MLPEAASLRSQFFTIMTGPATVKNFFFPKLSNEEKLMEKLAQA